MVVRSPAVLLPVWLMAACGNAPTAGPKDAGAPDESDGALPYDARESEAATSTCSGPSDGGALAPLEVLATGRSGLEALGVSNAGPVWFEDDGPDGARVLVGSTPPDVVFDTATSPLFVGGKHGDFSVGGDWFGFAYATYPPGGGELWVRTDGTVACQFVSGGMYDIRTDGLSEYELFISPPEVFDGGPILYGVAARPLSEACPEFNDAHTVVSGTEEITGIAVDETSLYLYVIDDASNS